MTRYLSDVGQAPKRRIWTNEMIEQELLKSIKVLGIERMPTASELCGIGRNDLHCKISRTKTYSGWAESLSLEMTSCDTRKGHKYEEIMRDRLVDMGFETERMTTKHAYDLLVNGLVKIDVKVGGVYVQKNGCKVNTFGISKKKQTCDIYILVSLDESQKVNRTFVIPSHLAKVVSISMGEKTYYERFQDRWDYIHTYDDFLRNIN